MLAIRYCTRLSLGAFIALFVLSGCSLFSSSRRPLNAPPVAATAVPKAQYDELVAKYDELNRKYESLKEGKAAMASSVAKSQDIDPSAELLSETVDAFPDANKVPKAPVKSMSMADAPDQLSNHPIPKEGMKGDAIDAMIDEKIKGPGAGMKEDSIESDITALRQGIAFIDAKKYDEAIKVFKARESSSYPQIQVRAKYYIGELLLRQGEFDLALQAYEEILQKFAFSGVVIDALRKCVICSEKLNLKEKTERYRSMLNDFFEAG